MTDPAESPNGAQPTAVATPAEPAPALPAAPSLLDAAPDRPELVIGGAFAGGLVLALLLKRLGR